MAMAVTLLLLLLVRVTSALSTFSLLYLGPDSAHSMQSLTLHSPPSVEHVADIVCRLHGLPPLLAEDHLNLPQIDVLLGKHSPLLVDLLDQGEVHSSRRYRT